MSARTVSFWADGVPVPQGSKRAMRHSKTGKVVMFDDNDWLEGWRTLVGVKARAALLRAGGGPFDGPLDVRLGFYFPRPKSHFGTGRNAGLVKATAPEWHTSKPDIDKLERAVFDALTIAGFWVDDSRPCRVSKGKKYADGAGPGVSVVVSNLEWGTL